MPKSTRPRAVVAGVTIVALANFFALPLLGDELLVTGWLSNSVVKYDGLTGELIDPIVPNGAGGLFRAHAAVIGPDGLLYVASFATDQILRYDPDDGTFIGVFVAAGGGGLNGPSDLMFAPNGNLCVTSFFTNNVLAYDGASGAFIEPFATGISSNPEALTFGPDGDLYVASGAGHRVTRYAGDTGAFVEIFVSPGAGGLNDPHDLVFGPDGHLYVSAFGAALVNKYNGETGAFIETFVADDPATPLVDESGGLSSPHGLAFGPDGHFYVASFGTDEVLRFDPATGDFENVFVTAGSGGINAPISLLFVGCAPCPTDANGDNDTGPTDLATLLVAWGPVEPGNCLDADSDGDIGPTDLATLLVAWGPCP